MKPFEFANPDSLDAAFALLDKSFDECEILAGGTDLLSLMKDFVIAPKRVVSLANVKELHGIKVAGDAVSIGAMTTLDELIAHPEIAARFPGLVQAAQGIKSPQLRAMGTVGGELLQRPRCWYFRRGFGLLAMKDGASMVEAGEHRYHAILGNVGPAKFVQPSSLAPMLIALGANAVIAGKGGARTIPVIGLFQVPSIEGFRETSLAPGEILKSIELKGTASTSSTYEVRHRHGLDWPEVGASVNVVLEGGKVKSVSAALGHVAPMPWDVSSAVSKALVGKALDANTATEAAKAALEGATPLKNNGHKVELARVALKRALTKAAGTPV